MKLGSEELGDRSEGVNQWRSEGVKGWGSKGVKNTKNTKEKKKKDGSLLFIETKIYLFFRIVDKYIIFIFFKKKNISAEINKQIV